MFSKRVTVVRSRCVVGHPFCSSHLLRAYSVAFNRSHRIQRPHRSQWFGFELSPIRLRPTAASLSRNGWSYAEALKEADEASRRAGENRAAFDTFYDR